MRSIHDLKIKSISELTIPDQLQSCVHLMELLINNLQDDSTISEIIKLIENKQIRPKFFKRLLYEVSCAFPHKKSSLSMIGEIMQKRQLIKKNCNLFYILFEDRLGSIIQSVIWDKIDELVNEIGKENFDINQIFKDAFIHEICNDERTLINIACKFGSENCFTFLKLKGATISSNTYLYAIEGGSKSIIQSFCNDNNFKITDEHLATALKYHRNDIFDWLLETRGYIGDLNIAECFYHLNIKGLLFLLENGFDINSRYYFHQSHLFIIIITHSSIIFVYHYYNTFVNHICLSLS